MQNSQAEAQADTTSNKDAANLSKELQSAPRKMNIEKSPKPLHKKSNSPLSAGLKNEQQFGAWSF